MAFNTNLGEPLPELENVAVNCSEPDSAHDMDGPRTDSFLSADAPAFIPQDACAQWQPEQPRDSSFEPAAGAGSMATQRPIGQLAPKQMHELLGIDVEDALKWPPRDNR